MEPGAAAFAVGLVITVGGVLLRGWSFKTLGEYFTFNVMVSSDQPVVTSGPYRLLRHPSYTGALLAEIGTGLLYGNWAGLAVLILLTLAMILWRIRVEEKALFTGLDNEYSAYAAGRKRIVPLLW